MAALAPALCVVGLTLLLILVVRVEAPQDLARLPMRDADLRRFAGAGHFPLSFAAALANRGALAAAAGLQTFACFALVAFSSAYAAWRGFLNARARGWSDAVWVVGLLFICLAPSLFGGLTWPMLDYAIIASAAAGDVPLPPFLAEIYGPHGLNSRMLPAAFLAERGLFAAFLASILAVFFHDLGYRLREALQEFGYLESGAESPGRGDYAWAGAGSRAHERAQGERGQGRHEKAKADRAGWDERAAPPPAEASDSEEARARFVLGVGANASRGEIERAYRNQMKRAHPDRGGSVERAAALNAARDVLLPRG